MSHIKKSAHLRADFFDFELDPEYSMRPQLILNTWFNAACAVEMRNRLDGHILVWTESRHQNFEAFSKPKSVEAFATDFTPYEDRTTHVQHFYPTSIAVTGSMFERKYRPRTDKHSSLCFIRVHKHYAYAITQLRKTQCVPRFQRAFGGIPMRER